MVEHRILDSQIWPSLSNAAVRAYVSLKRAYNGFNGDTIKVSYAYFQKHGIKSSSTISHALKELQECGLIDIATFGGLHRQCNVYRLSDRWKVRKK